MSSLACQYIRQTGCMSSCPTSGSHHHPPRTSRPKLLDNFAAYSSLEQRSRSPTCLHRTRTNDAGDPVDEFKTRPVLPVDFSSGRTSGLLFASLTAMPGGSWPTNQFGFHNVRAARIVSQIIAPRRLRLNLFDNDRVRKDNPVIPMGWVSPLTLSDYPLVGDLRGHGRSPAPSGVYEMDLLARDVLALLDALLIKKAVIMGHSMGGYVALAAWKLAPERFLALGLIDSQAGADTEEGRQGRYKMAEKVAAEGSKVVAEAMLPKLFAPNLPAEAPIIDQVRQMILNTPPAGIIGTLKGMAVRPDSGAAAAQSQHSGADPHGGQRSDHSTR